MQFSSGTPKLTKLVISVLHVVDEVVLALNYGFVCELYPAKEYLAGGVGPQLVPQDCNFGEK